MTNRSDYETVRDAVDALAYTPWLESVPKNVADFDANHAIVNEFTEEVASAHGWTVDDLIAEATRRCVAE